MNTVLILLASYNGQKYLNEMIDSLINQDYEDWHLVLSDDGSSDSTPEILESYSNRYPDKITHYRSGQRFGNAQDHFMHLLKEFHDAPYIMFCDQDDVWHSDKISKTLAKMKEIEENPKQPAMVHTDLRVVDGNLNVIDPSFMHFSKLNGERLALNQLLIQNVVTGCTLMINNALACISVNNIPKSGIIMHDWWLALIAVACGKTGFLNEATIDYRQHGGNVVGAKNTRSLSYILQKASGKAIRQALFDTSVQAEVFAKELNDYISQNKKEVIAAFGKIHSSNYFMRKIIYLKYKFFKNGAVRCIAQFLVG